MVVSDRAGTPVALGREQETASTTSTSTPVRSGGFQCDEEFSGVHVRWESSYDANSQSFVERTLRFRPTAGGGGTPRCGLLGIEALLPLGWFALRRRSQRS